MPRLLVIALLLLAAPAPAAQQGLPVPVRQAADGITADRLARDLEFLAADALRGRNTPSPGFDTAAAYIATRLEQAGLRPMGDAGSFFQRYEMRESRVQTDAAALEIDGRRFRFGDGFVMRSLAGPVSGTYPVVYVGHGWTVPDRGIDPYAGVDVRGKVVLAHGPRALPKGVEIRQIGRVSIGARPVVMEAQQRGAVAVVIVPQSSALEGWEQARSQNLVRRELEPPVPSAYAAPAMTSVMVAAQTVDALLAGERVSGAELMKLGDAADYPPSFQLSKSIRVHIPAAVVTHRPYNVVAGIDGSDPVLRNEYLTIASHLDGAVGTRTVDGDAIYNSADDNASGSAATLSIAEQMTTVRPKRSLIFIWDSGEERGLWGTRHFVHTPPVPLDRIVAHFNIDMIGASRAPGSADAASPDVTGPDEVYVAGPGVLSGQVDGWLERVNREYLNLRFNRRYDRPDSEFFYPRTDAGPFLERGILTIGFFTGLHPRYHLPADEARHLDPKKMEAIARTVFACAWALADSPERPRIDRPIPATVPRYGGLVNQRATGTFDVKLAPQPLADTTADKTLGRMSIDKTYAGDLEATARGEMLTALTATEGSAGYVAIERVSGALRGRRGTFVLQHTGTMTRGAQQLSVTVVPDSGTGELTGLSGQMTIRIADGRHYYEFEYALPGSAPSH